MEDDAQKALILSAIPPEYPKYAIYTRKMESPKTRQKQIKALLLKECSNDITHAKNLSSEVEVEVEVGAGQSRAAWHDEMILLTNVCNRCCRTDIQLDHT